MPKKDYLPADEAGQLELVGNLATKLPAYADTLKLDAVDVEKIQAGHRYLQYLRDAAGETEATLRALNAEKVVAKFGGRQPVVPVVRSTPPAPPPEVDILGHARTLAQHIKNHPRYTEAIGRALGLIGPETASDETELRPNLRIKLDAGHPSLSWQRNRTDAIEIHVARGTGDYELLAVTTDRQFLDTAPLPLPGVAAVWRYKAIYRRKNAKIGQWSKPETATVVG